MISSNQESRSKMMTARTVICCAAWLLSCGTSAPAESLTSREEALFSAIKQPWQVPTLQWDYLADVTGDGKSDAIWRSPSGLIYFNESTGNAFIQWAGTLEWLPSYGYQLADVNGDCKADIIGVGPRGDIMVSLSAGSYFESGTVWSHWDTRYDYQFADVNDDGKADIIGVGPNTDIMVALSTGSAFASGTVWQYWSPSYDHHFADVNGDGKADAIGVSGTNVVVALSNGTGFVGPALTWADWNAAYPHRFLRVDADTKSDLIGVSATRNVRVGLSTGSEFAASQLWEDSIRAGAPSSQAGASGNMGGASGVDFADVNGDGALDRLSRPGAPLGAGGFLSFTDVQLGELKDASPPCVPRP